MSDRSREQGPSQTPTEERYDTTAPRSHPPSDADRYAQGPASAAPSSAQQHLQPVPGRTFELPPLPQASTGGGFRTSGSRLAGVSSILNPTEENESQHGRRRKASELDSPAGPSPGPAFPPSSTGQHRPSPSPRLMPGSLNDRQPRRLLTPRSPSLYRAASSNQLNTTVGTINSQQTPFLVSPRTRPYAIEHGVGDAPPLPTPPAAARLSYGVPGLPPTSEETRRASSGGTRGTGPTSASASPSTSFSSYSQTSPATQYAPGPHHSSANESSGPEHQRPMGIPISSSGGQNVYQMMTLETTSGTVQLPVDVQAASRVADEKRRRNAGASARFRQRRKEKEKESSTTISRLEQRLKEVAEDMDFYKRERDQLAGMLRAVPGGDRHFPRPLSPRSRRSSMTMARPSGSIDSAYSMQDERDRSPGGARNVRRRTSTISLPPPPPPLAPQGAAMPRSGTPYQPGYPTPYGGVPPQQQPPLQHPPSAMNQGGMPTPPLPGPLHHQQPSHGPLGPPQLMQAPPQTSPWNPYAADRRPQGPSGPPHHDAR